MRYFLLIIIIAVAIAFGGYRYVTYYYQTPNTKQLSTETVIVDNGSSLTKIAYQLARKGVITQPDLFILIAKLTKQTNPKHGEYEFGIIQSPKQILEKLENGDVVIRKFTIPEGKTSYEILGILQQLDAVSGNLPENIEEGSVLPQTYHYQYGDSYAEIIKKMQADMSDVLAKEWANRSPNLPLKSPEEALILASMIEKETGLDGERELVAGVFINRLNKPMRLESDPTAVYGITLGKPLDDKVRAKHVRDENEYNTYIINRLPPTPIAAPGIESIRAALNPPQTDYFYFVANGKGGHNFAKTLKEHNENIAKYRKALKSNAN